MSFTACVNMATLFASQQTENQQLLRQIELAEIEFNRLRKIEIASRNLMHCFVKADIPKYNHYKVDELRDALGMQS